MKLQRRLGNTARLPEIRRKWKTVPAQVKVFPESGRPFSRQMPVRFQAEIDRIAMKQGLAGTDDYLNRGIGRPSWNGRAILPRFWTR